MHNTSETKINAQHIRNEAYRVFKITGCSDEHANWQEAIENLKIFPKHLYDARGITIHYLPTNDGWFGYITIDAYRRKSMYWHVCRETFERELRREEEVSRTHSFDHGNFEYAFFIAAHAGCEYRVPNFIRNIELDRLQLNELTTFMHVQYKPPIVQDVPRLLDDSPPPPTTSRLSLVRPSSFWTCCPMRFSLFTILIRAGRFYYFNSIEDALMSYNYSRTTFAAINLFFQGRRNYTGEPPTWSQKWLFHYQDLHESQVLTLVA